MIYTSIRPYPRHSRRPNPRHRRRMTRAQRKELVTLIRLMAVGLGFLMGMCGSGPDPAVATNFPLTIAGCLISVIAAIGIDDGGRA